MSQTRTKLRKTTKLPPIAPPPPIAPASRLAAPASEVLTLSEAAAYLRVPEAEVLRLAERQELPSRLVGAEWRFLKSALADWLRSARGLVARARFSW